MYWTYAYHMHTSVFRFLQAVFLNQAADYLKDVILSIAQQAVLLNATMLDPESLIAIWLPLWVERIPNICVPIRCQAMLGLIQSSGLLEALPLDATNTLHVALPFCGSMHLCRRKWCSGWQILHEHATHQGNTWQARAASADGFPLQASLRSLAVQIWFNYLRVYRV